MILMTPIPVHRQRTTQQIRLIRRRIIQIKAIRIITNNTGIDGNIPSETDGINGGNIPDSSDSNTGDNTGGNTGDTSGDNKGDSSGRTIRVEVPAILLAVPQQMTAIQPVQTRISKLDGEGNGR